MPDPGPFGETSLRAIVRAMCSADPLKVRGGGCVESVVTVLTHRRVDRFFAIDCFAPTPLAALAARTRLAGAGAGFVFPFRLRPGPPRELLLLPLPFGGPCSRPLRGRY